jgi:hypothetical protein
MSSNLLGELVANNGTFILNVTEENFIYNIDQIIILEDTIFNGIFIGDYEDVKSTYLADSSIAIKAGARITPINNIQFNAVNLASGSVELVLSA